MIARIIFTVRSTVRKCCLGAIDPDRSRIIHTPRAAKLDVVANIGHLARLPSVGRRHYLHKVSALIIGQRSHQFLTV